MSLLRGEGLPNQFSHKAAKDLAGFMSTANYESQAFAIDATAQDVQDTGTKAVMINGVYIPALTADAALDVSADAQLGVWAAAQSYTAYHMRYVLQPDGQKKYYKCILAHTSAAANKPGTVTGLTYWKESDQTAEAAVGQSIPESGAAWYACLATADGTLTLVKAGDVATVAANVELKIPKFEPEMFVCIGLLHVAPTSGAHVLGTTVLTTVGTFYQVIGPVVPHPDNL